MNFVDRPMVLPALVLGGGLVLGLALVGWGIAAKGQQNVITATGSASQTVTADQASWTIDLTSTVYDPSEISRQSQIIASNLTAVSNYLSNKKLAGATITTKPVSVVQNFNYNSNSISSYSLSASVTVATSDVNSIDSLYHDTGSLDALESSGVMVSAEPPAYQISSLPNLRVSLLGAAIKDARARAEQIAKSGGSRVGPIQTASSGVVQVLAPNSTQVEDYGTYDTSTIQKNVMVTVRASFYVK